MTYLDGADYFVRVVPLPVGIRGMVSPNSDGTYCIYISSQIPSEQQLESYFHEVGHIENDDFNNGKSMEEGERL